VSTVGRPRSASVLAVALGALVAPVCAIAAGGCASLLGGLDEGSTVSTDAGADVPSNDAATHDARCDAWLAGFRYRTPLVVEHVGAAISGYQVKLSLPTAALIAAGKLRADAADVRVTSADGVTLLPYWIQDGIGTSSITLWTRVDLEAGTNRAWLYYGSEAAADHGSLAATFASGIVDDPSFDRSDAWVRAHEDTSNKPASRTNEWSVSLVDGKATVRIFRGSDTDGALAGICQTMLFPGGSSYRFVFDIDVTLADHGSTRVAHGGLGAVTVWRSLIGQIGFLPAQETADLAPGTRSVCLAVNVEGEPVGQGVEATFSAPRVRRVTKPEPTVALPGAELEAAGCP
jgi:hypothetical protein